MTENVKCWKDNLSYINKVLNEEGEQITITEDLVWDGQPLSIKSVTKKDISYVYDGKKYKTGLHLVNMDIINLITNSIKNNKFL